MKNDQSPFPLRPGHVPSAEELVQEAASNGLVESALRNLPSNVANALRSMMAGERPAPTLSPRDIAKLGKIIGRWGVPYGRSSLGFGLSMGAMMAQVIAPSAPGETTITSKTPQQVKKKDRRKISEELTECLGLPSHKAARVEAVVHWPIGFLRRDLAHWGLLSEEETEAVWDYIVREYGLYTTGTLYAVP